MSYYNTFAEMYKDICENLLFNPEYKCSPRGKSIHEITNAQIKINDPISCLYTNEKRGTPLKYLKDELTLYFKGSNLVQDFEKASKFWSKLSDNGETINSAYGYLLFNIPINEYYSQWDWCYNALRDDKDTRQALMFVSTPSVQYIGVKDFICTLNYHFYIRENELHLIVNRRSNDMILGIPFDIPWECALMQCMLFELRQLKQYKELQLGTYNLNINSLHLYENNFELVKEMLLHDFKPIDMPIIDDYVIHSKEINKIYENRLYNGKNEIKDNKFFKWLNEGI